MVTLHNRVLPEKKLLFDTLIGKQINTTPKVLTRIPRRSITVQYGSGANAIIYGIWGHPGDLNAEAVSKGLEPK